MAGLECFKQHYLGIENIMLNNLFGFYYCEIDAPVNSYLGLVTLINKEGIYFPTGKWKAR